MVNKEFKVNKDTKKIINYDGKEISVDEFNRLYYAGEKEIEKNVGDYPVLVRFGELFEEIFWAEESYKAFKKLHPNLEADIEDRWRNFDTKFNNFTKLDEGMDFKDDESIKKLEEVLLKKYDKKVKEAEDLVAHMELLVKQKKENEENDNPDQSYEDKKKQANELRELIDGAVEAIKKALKQEPQISDGDLESDNRNWLSLIGYALSEKQVNDIKSRVLADISTKRATKQGKNKEPLTGQELNNFARDAIYEIDTERNSDEGTDLFVTSEELEKNNPDWRQKIIDAANAGNEKEVKHIKVKVLVDLRFRKAEKQKGKKQAASLDKSITDALNSKVDEMSDNEMAELMELFQRLEGENKVESLRDKSKSVEEKLMENNPDLYRQTVISSLLGRIKEYKINPDDLSEETRQLISGEIIQVEEIKESLEKAIKEIGEVAARSKWTSLFSQATALLAKVKGKVTEQVKNDLKTIQKQLNDFKAGTNSYLSSIYKDNKAKADRLEQDLSNISATSQTGSPKETPWGVIIPVSLVAIALVGVVATIIVRNRKQSKAKEAVE